MNEKPINQESDGFKEWAVVELFEHQKIAGLVTVQNIGGPFLRVDVPDAAGNPLFSRFYAPNAIYSMSPVSRQIAIGMAVKLDVQPVHRYDFTQLVKGPPELPLGDNEDPAYD